MLLSYTQSSETSAIHSLNRSFRGKIQRIDEKWNKKLDQRLHARRASQSLSNKMNLTLRSELQNISRTSTNYRLPSKFLNPQRKKIQKNRIGEHSHHQNFHTIDTVANQKNKMFFTPKKLSNYIPNDSIKTERDQRQNRNSGKYQNIQGLYVVQVQESKRLDQAKPRNVSPSTNFRRGLRILKLKTNQKLKHKETQRQRQKIHPNQIKTQQEQKINQIQSKKNQLKSLLHGRSIQPFIQAFKMQRQFSQRQ